MKTKNIFKVLALAMLMPAMLLTTACSNEDDAINNGDNKKGYPLQVTINVTRQGDDATRAEYNTSTKKLSFTTGDKLFVNGNDAGVAGNFAGALNYDTESGKFTGTIYTQNSYSGTADALFTAASDNGFVNATLLPAGYGSYGYLYIRTYDDVYEYNDEAAQNNTYTLATSKAAGVEQFSYEKATGYSSSFPLAPKNAILNFTITGLAASTDVAVSLTGSGYTITKTVTTDGSGNATFAAGVSGGKNLNDFSLTVGGNPITLVTESKTLTAGKIYNITRAVTPPTLAETKTTAGMTVKVKYNYQNQNYCLFSSNGDGTYTFQSGSGFAGGDEGDAKALVVEGGKLVFKQNFFSTIDNLWSTWGFSVTFDTSNNTYSNWFGGSNYYNPSFISVEVNSVPIALTQKITVSDLVKEQGQSWSVIIDNNSDKIKEEGGYVVRKSDSAKLQYSMYGDTWQDVYTMDDYQTMGTYKFEGD